MQRRFLNAAFQVDGAQSPMANVAVGDQAQAAPAEQYQEMARPQQQQQQQVQQYDQQYEAVPPVAVSSLEIASAAPAQDVQGAGFAPAPSGTSANDGWEQQPDDVNLIQVGSISNFATAAQRARLSAERGAMIAPPVWQKVREDKNAVSSIADLQMTFISEEQPSQNTSNRVIVYMDHYQGQDPAEYYPGFLGWILEMVAYGIEEGQQVPHVFSVQAAKRGSEITQVVVTFAALDASTAFLERLQGMSLPVQFAPAQLPEPTSALMFCDSKKTMNNGSGVTVEDLKEWLPSGAVCIPAYDEGTFYATLPSAGDLYALLSMSDSASHQQLLYNKFGVVYTALRTDAKLIDPAVAEAEGAAAQHHHHHHHYQQQYQQDPYGAVVEAAAAAPAEDDVDAMMRELEGGGEDIEFDDDGMLVVKAPVRPAISVGGVRLPDAATNDAAGLLAIPTANEGVLELNNEDFWDMEPATATTTRAPRKVPGMDLNDDFAFGDDFRDQSPAPTQEMTALVDGLERISDPAIIRTQTVAQASLIAELPSALRDRLSAVLCRENVLGGMLSTSQTLSVLRSLGKSSVMIRGLAAAVHAIPKFLQEFRAAQMFTQLILASKDPAAIILVEGALGNAAMLDRSMNNDFHRKHLSFMLQAIADQHKSHLVKSTLTKIVREIMELRGATRFLDLAANLDCVDLGAMCERLANGSGAVNEETTAAIRRLARSAVYHHGKSTRDAAVLVDELRGVVTFLSRRFADVPQASRGEILESLPPALLREIMVTPPEEAASLGQEAEAALTRARTSSHGGAGGNAATAAMQASATGFRMPAPGQAAPAGRQSDRTPAKPQKETQKLNKETSIEALKEIASYTYGSDHMPFPALPQGWMWEVSLSHGHYYFINPRSKKTTYRHPDTDKEYKAPPQQFVRSHLRQFQARRAFVNELIGRNSRDTAVNFWLDEPQHRDEKIDQAIIRELRIRYKNRDADEDKKRRRDDSDDEARAAAKKRQDELSKLPPWAQIVATYPASQAPFPMPGGSDETTWKINVSASNGLYYFTNEANKGAKPSYKHPETGKEYLPSPQSFAARKIPEAAAFAKEIGVGTERWQKWMGDQRHRDTLIDDAVIKKLNIRFPKVAVNRQ